MCIGVALSAWSVRLYVVGVEGFMLKGNIYNLAINASKCSMRVPCHRKRQGGTQDVPLIVACGETKNEAALYSQKNRCASH